MVDVTELRAWSPTEHMRRSYPRRDPIPDEDWITHLTASGPVREDAVARLHALMLRAASYQVSRMSESAGLGARRRDDIVHAAADEATVSVLARLDTFEGRSRFTTWAYKFGILHAAVEIRRSAWRGREVDLYSVPEPTTSEVSPETHAEVEDLADAVRHAIMLALTPHQRRVALALLVDEVPIDVLAERLGTTRNALYKTLHDARKALRVHLIHEGFLNSHRTEEATP